MRRRSILTAVAAMALVSCGQAASTAPSSTTQLAAVDTSVAPTSTSTSTTSPAGPTLADLTEGLPRSSSYSILDVEIDEAAIGDVDPRTFLRDQDVVAESTYLFLHLQLHNRSDTDTANWVPSPVHLLVDDELMPAPSILEGRPNLGLTPLMSTEMWLAFEVPDDTEFANASFVLAQEGRIPMVLPLTGPVPHLDYPVELDLSGEGPARGKAVGCRQSLAVTLLGGSVSIDLIDSDYPTAYGARRANAGERFLSVPLRVLNNGGSRCGGGSSNFSNDDVRIIVDGVPRPPITWVNVAIPLDTAADFTFHFAYPESASEVLLAVGSDEATLFAVPVDLSHMPGIAHEWLLDGMR